MPVSIVVPAGGGSNPFGSEVDLSEMQQIATARLLGNISGGNAVPSALTIAQVLAFLGTGTPGSGNYLRGDGSWQAISGGKLIQQVYNIDGVYASGTTIIPFDNTIPQSNEGTQFYSLDITPASASNTLVIMTNLWCYRSTVVNACSALFQDSTADALAVSNPCYTSSGSYELMQLIHIMTAGTTSSTTFKLRAGPASSATIYVNGNNSTGLFGGRARSGIMISEIAV